MYERGAGQKVFSGNSVFNIDVGEFDSLFSTKQIALHNNRLTCLEPYLYQCFSSQIMGLDPHKPLGGGNPFFSCEISSR